MPICPKCGTSYAKVGVPCTNAICIPDGVHSIHDDEVTKAETDPRIGRLAVDKYVITGRISKGGMGAVYRALQLPVEREVAFKVLRTELEDSSQGRDRFIQEAKAISKLQHANIIVLYDFGFEPSGHPYMVMEYAPGKSLADWMTRETLTTDRILHITQQLLAALEEAHRMGIVHRDLKPENMIIVNKGGSQQDVVKLLDFGIARVITESSTRGLTREGEIFGTPHYMAPEQAQGAKNVTAAADVYAVGIMLYELLCGEAPFDADSPLAVLLKHISEPLPPLRPRPGVHIWPELEDFVQRACAKAPEARFPDAAQMLQALLAMTGRSVGFQTGSYPTLPAQRDLSGELRYTPPRDTLQDPPPSQLTTKPSPTPQPSAGFAPAPTNLPTGQFGPLDASLDTLEPPAAPGRAKLIFGLVALIVLIGGAGVTIAMIQSSKDAPEQPLAASGDPSPAIKPPAAQLDDPGQTPKRVDAQDPTPDPDPDEPPDAGQGAGPDLGQPDMGLAADPKADATTDPDANKAASKNTAKTPKDKTEKTKTVRVEPKADPPKEEPKKFEPKKFGVKEEPQEAPKKFEPKKFGVKEEPQEAPKKFEPKKFDSN